MRRSGGRSSWPDACGHLERSRQRPRSSPAAFAPVLRPAGPMLARSLRTDRLRSRNMLWQAGIVRFGMIRIDGKRLLADLRELASIGAYKTGVDRVALSPEDIAARRWLVGKLEAAGLTASMDRI